MADIDYDEAKKVDPQLLLEVFDAWKTLYFTRLPDPEEDESVQDRDFEDMAIGFAMAKGMTYYQAMGFYHDVCVKERVF